MDKIRVGIVYGGRSVEHDISRISATNIVSNIDENLFDVTLIGISKSGDWFLCGDITSPIIEGTPLNLSLSASLTVLFTDQDQVILDVIFPVLHGTDGEDGSIQGLLQTMNLPYVGSGVLGSAVAMDKLLSKRVLENAGIPVAKFMDFGHDQRHEIHFQEIASQLGLPFMMKPTNLGSSVGVAKIKSIDGFEAAVDETFQYDNHILFEEYVVGREMECGVLGNANPIASAPGEIILSPEYEFYSFEAKYENPDAVSIVLPAEVDERTREAIKLNSIAAFKVLGCKDFARIDLFVLSDGSVRINEINTIPGFTNISMYPKLMGLEGYDYPDLITTLIKQAIDRTEAEARTTTQFDNNL